MRIRRRTNPNFVNGVPELVVLQLLARGDMYGYQIVQAIHRESQERFQFGEGCIYPVLHELERNRWVTSRRLVVAGRSRHYYQLTALGRKRMGQLSEEWERVAAGLAHIMGAKLT